MLFSLGPVAGVVIAVERIESHAAARSHGGTEEEGDNDGDQLASASGSGWGGGGLKGDYGACR